MSYWASAGLIPAVFVAAAAIVWGARTVANRLALVDRPNERSAHVVPKPRLGGIGIVVACAFGAAVLLWYGALPRSAMASLAGVAAIALLGVVDDVRPLSSRTRFAVQVTVAALVAFARWGVLPRAAGPLLGTMLPAWALAALFVFWAVWLTNLYNFMDGIDGLAGGQAVIAGVAIALSAAAVGASGTAWLALIVVAASLGFLLFNFPPSSIFMGDVGSTSLGFFFACVPLLSDGPAVPVAVPAIAVSLFILDATTTLIRRMWQGERWTTPHRTHLYQRPLAVGFSHRAIVLWAFLGMTIAAGASVVYGPGIVRRAAALAPVLAFLVFRRMVVVAEGRAVSATAAGADAEPEQRKTA